MSLTKKFNIAVNQWRHYIAHGRGPSGTRVKISSLSTDIYDCEPCRRIVGMGNSALHLIRQLYDINKDSDLETIKGHGLLIAVGLIVGQENFQIPEKMAGRINEMEAYTKNWLDENTQKYCVVDNN